MPIASLRQEYSRASLLEQDAASDPFDQFGKWFDEARKAELPDPNAMTLATVDEDGQPSARIVLLKGFDRDGFLWFTNYHSRKGHALQAQPRAALLFYWQQLERQVSIEGRVERISAAESEAYFMSRPRASRIGALASEQSAPIAGREQLDAKFAAAVARVGDDEPMRPAQWGGYRLTPHRIEFWQGRSSRLHDRLVYTLAADQGWLRERLQP
jgi:pyridoxamine 5'-phosphate oxidase